MPALATRPELYPDLELYWNAYMTLSASRQGEMEPERLSVESVVAYCDLIQLRDVHERLNVLHAVQLLDAEAFSLLRERRKAKEMGAQAPDR